VVRKGISYSQIIKLKENVIDGDSSSEVETIMNINRSVLSVELHSLGNFDTFKQRLLIAQENKVLSIKKRNKNRQIRRERSIRKHNRREDSDFLVGVEENPGEIRFHMRFHGAGAARQRVIYLHADLDEASIAHLHTYWEEFREMTLIMNLMLQISDRSTNQNEDPPPEFTRWAQRYTEICAQVEHQTFNPNALVHDVETNPGMSKPILFSISRRHPPDLHDCIFMRCKYEFPDEQARALYDQHFSAYEDLKRAYTKLLRRDITMDRFNTIENTLFPNIMHHPKYQASMLTCKEEDFKEFPNDPGVGMFGVQLPVPPPKPIKDHSSRGEDNFLVGVETNPGEYIHHIASPPVDDSYFREQFEKRETQPRMDWNYLHFVPGPRDCNFSRPVDRDFVRLEALTKVKDRSYGLGRSQKAYLDHWTSLRKRPYMISKADYAEWIKPQTLHEVDFQYGPYEMPFQCETDGIQMQVNVGLDKETKDFLKNGITVEHKFPSVPSLPNFGVSGNAIYTYIMEHKEIGMLIFAALGAAFVYQKMSNPLLKSILTVASAVLGTSYVSMPAAPYITKLVDMAVVDRIEDVSEIKMQAQVSTGDIVDVLGTCIVGGLLGSATAKSVETKDATHFFRCFGPMAQVKAGVTSLVDFVVNITKRFADWLGGREKLAGYEIFEDRYPNFAKSAKAVNEFVEKMRQDPTYNYANGQDCFALEREINNIITSIPNGDPQVSGYKAEAYRLLARLTPLINCFSSENLTSAARKLPTCVWVSGDSGVGKSSCLKKLITEVYGRVASETKWAIYRVKPSDQIYAYDYTRDFWDSYHGQAITIVDEAGLMREVAGATNDGFMSIIRMVNIFDFPLNMADLPKKGKTYFCSDFVFVTSNREHVSDIKSLYYPDAYLNRMQLSYHQVVKQEFATPETRDLRPWARKVNRKLIPNPEDETLDFSWVEYIPIDLKTGIQKRPVVSFDETVEEIVEKYYENDSFGERALKSYQADVTKMDAWRAAKAKKTTDPAKLATGDYEYDYEKILPKRKSYEKQLDELLIKRDFLVAKAKVEKKPPSMSELDKLLADITNLADLMDGEPPKPKVAAPILTKEDGSLDQTISELEDLIAKRARLHPKIDPRVEHRIRELVSFRDDVSTYYTDTESSDEESDQTPPEVKPQMNFDLYGYMKGRIQPYVERNVNSVIADRLIEAGNKLKDRSKPLCERFDFQDDPFDCETDAVAHITDFNRLPKWFLACVAKAYQFNIDFFIRWARDSELKFVGDEPQAVQLAVAFNREVTCTKGNVFAEAWNVVYNGITLKGVAIGLLVGVGLMASIIALVQIFAPSVKKNTTNFVYNNVETVEEEEVVDKDGRRWVPQSGKAKAKAKSRPSNRLRKLGQLSKQIFMSDSNTDDKMFKVVRNNQYLLQFKGNFSGFLTFYDQNLCFMPKHFYDVFKTVSEVEPEVEVILHPCDGSTPITKRVEDILGDHIRAAEPEMPGRVGDYVFFEMSGVRPHGDIISHFVSDDDPLLKETFHGVVMKYLMTPKAGVYSSKPAVLTPLADIEYDDGCGGKYHLDKCFGITMSTRDGDCGMLYWSADQTKLVSKIVAMHVSGNQRTGFGVCITSNLLKMVRKQFQDQVIDEPKLPLSNELDVAGIAKQMGLGQFRVLGTTKPLFNGAKNNVIPSPLHEKWGPSDYEPAPVQQRVINGELTDPLGPSRAKINKNDKPMNDMLYTEATDSYIASVFRGSDEAFYGNGLVPWDEAICGRPGIWQGIPLATSPGYPYTEGNKAKGKKFWFGGEDGYDLEKPAAVEMLKYLNSLVEMMERGERPTFIFKDSPKVERRKKGKPCRQVNASPMDYFVICRRYLGAFAVWFMANVLKNGSAMGINPYGEQWDAMGRTLQRFFQAMAGDYSAWDGSLTPQMMQAIVRMIERFYISAPAIENQVRKILLLDLIYSRHVVTVTAKDDIAFADITIEEGDYIDVELPAGSAFPLHVIQENLAPGRYRMTRVGEVDVFLVTVVYEWRGGMPSGHFLTTIGNIIVNNCVLRYAFADQILGGKALSYNIRSSSPFAFIEANFWLCCFGDDNVIGMTEAGAELVSQDGTTESLARIGLKYTDENKSTGLVGRRVFTQISFLKRSFRYEPLLGRFVAPLELAVILEMPYWTKTNEQPGAFNQTCRTTLRELALHGRDVFQMHALTMAIHMIDIGVDLPEMSFEACLRAAVTMDASHL
jgi:hypothetical protein